MNTRTPLYQTVAHHTHTHISYNKGLKTLNSNKLITAVYPITLLKHFLSKNISSVQTVTPVAHKVIHVTQYRSNTINLTLHTAVGGVFN